MLVDYQPWHLISIELTPEARAAAERLCAAEGFRSLSALNMVGTIVSSDPPALLGIMGICPTAKDAGEVFILASLSRRRYPAEFAKTVWRALRRARQQFGRITALGDDSPGIDRWLKWLGFRPLGLVTRPDLLGEQMRLWSTA